MKRITYQRSKLVGQQLKSVQHNLLLVTRLFCSVSLILLVLLGGFSSANAQFVHPGITHKKSDLDRMKYMVEAQIDPWYSSYQTMVADSKSSYDYVVQGDVSFTELGRDDGTNYSAWNSDIRAAYYNAICWYVTGDTRHADKAVEIFNAWKNLTNVTSGGTYALSGGIGYIMIEAAEIIKSTYSGWATADIDAFKAMLVYPGYSTTTIPTGTKTFYWNSYKGDAARHGNQGLSAWRTVMAMGIFLDNEIMYERALRYIKGLPHRSDDLPYPSGPNTSVALLSSTEYADTYSFTAGTSIEDYGFDEVMTNYIWENGQCQESSRDQQHTAFGIGLLTSMAEMAWNQGEDLYAHSDDRLLLGLEYNMRYNVSAIQSYDDQPSAWEPTVASGEFIQRFDRTGRWFSKAISPDGRGDFSSTRPVFEMPVAHFYGRGLKTAEEVKWITRARDKAIELSGYELAGWSNDAIGWGGLTARRPDYCYGDPISGFDSNGLPMYAMNLLPTIEAENFDYAELSREGRVYHDVNAVNTGGAYRTAEDVDIETCTEGGYNLTDIESGEWVTYTLYVPETAEYAISMRYAASQAGGTVKLSFAGEETTSEVAVPFGSPNSTGESDWQTATITSNAVLYKGVQSLKVSFGGVSNAFKVNNFSLVKSGIAKQEQTINFFTIPYKVVGSDDFDPAATASSGLAVSYASSNTSVATIVDGKVHVVGVGTTTITASQAGNESYFAAPNATRVLTVVANNTASVSLPTVADTYVNGGSTSTNYGAATSLVTKGGATGRYAYFKFDLSSLTGPVVSAKLRLYQRTSYIEERSVYDVADDSWTETEIIWNNKPAYENERATISTSKATWNEWDVSSYVAQEYNNDKVITMVVINPSASSTAGIDFYSKEFGSNAPELVVTCYNGSPTAVETVQNSSSSVYPNPASGIVYVSLSDYDSSADGFTASLFNSLGVKIDEIDSIHSNTVPFDLSSLENGMYFIQIRQGDKQFSHKVLKR
ncbi:DNRLRE domain-containing protein [Mangrovibacterium sp.]|uniref:CBM96 family carbohydrate-binding protein n=1 Tax=Mangrovibacterium sp. TaxID=1961364 RepID=UPI003566800C